MECLFANLIKNKEFSKQIKPVIELAFKNIKFILNFFNLNQLKNNGIELKLRTSRLEPSQSLARLSLKKIMPARA
jgi:hypothetical protein